jgi:hypothetical protein
MCLEKSSILRKQNLKITPDLAEFLLQSIYQKLFFLLKGKKGETNVPIGPSEPAHILLTNQRECWL